jgi:hypothetical protein
MKQLKINLSYDAVLALDAVINSYITIPADDYATKCITALLIEWSCKKLKPLQYFRFHKPKTISLSMAVACAVIYMRTSIAIQDAYQDNVLDTIIQTIHPKTLN